MTPPTPHLLVPVQAPTDVSAVRRAAVQMAEKAGLSEPSSGVAAIVATEAASNVLKHALGGEVLLRWCEPPERAAVEIIALDKGPGMGDVGRCFEDGYSTAGSAGTGLGAMRRLSSFLTWFSHPASGTIVVCRVAEGRAKIQHEDSPFEISGINVPYPGEEMSGDAWISYGAHNVLRLLLADGLGHGVFAHEASSAATDRRSISRFDSPVGLMEALHVKLRPTRGAAASAAFVDLDNRNVKFCGVGNVAGMVLAPGGRRQMVSGNGTLGRESRRLQEFTYPLAEACSLIVLHSDGLSSNWSLDKYPGLFQSHPSVVAAVLYRDYRRTRDDASVVVARVGSVH